MKRYSLDLAREVVQVVYVLEGVVDQELFTHVANHVLHQLLVLVLFLSPSLYPDLWPYQVVHVV